MKTIKDIKAEFDACSVDMLDGFIAACQDDGRSGVEKIVAQAGKKIKDHEKELERLDGMLVYEDRHSDAVYIAGIDEVGRGPLAGPVVSAAVVMPKGLKIPYVNDSKKCSEKLRERLYDEIMEKAVSVGIGIVSPGTIDRINILQATIESMKTAISELDVKADVLLVDAVNIPGVDAKQVSIIKGDEKSQSIAAASIIAKVTRDRMMKDYDELYPGYGFASNKGYGSKEHIEGIKSLGPTPIHRISFIGNFL